MEEGFYTFIYKTVKEYNSFERYILDKLQKNNINERQRNGYLIKKQYYDYWKKFSDYDELKNYIENQNYNVARPIIKQYRNSNKFRQYQPDAYQHVFNSSESLYNAIKKENKGYVLINENMWKLICYDQGLNEMGGTKYKIGKQMITFYFDKNDECEILTNDNIIDNTKEIYINKNMSFYPYNEVRLNKKPDNYYNNDINNNNIDNNNIDNNNVDDKDSNNSDELKKVVLLYAYERELKNKINNLTYCDKKFGEYYLISKEWIQEYKKFYHFAEIASLIEHKESLKKLLNKGFYEARKNMHQILKKISFKGNISIKNHFPAILKDNNTFLTERNEIIMSNGNKVSYWRNFEIVNSDLKNLLCQSDLHEYDFENVSDAKCLITGGKVIIDLSKDDYNPNISALEIGTVNNDDMTFNDEFIFRYDDDNYKDDSLDYFKNNFLNFQREHLNFGIDLESELYSKEGNVYGNAFKIPPHD